MGAKEKGDKKFYLIFINNVDNMKTKFVILIMILMSILEMNEMSRQHNQLKAKRY